MKLAWEKTTPELWKLRQAYANCLLAVCPSKKNGFDGDSFHDILKESRQPSTMIQVSMLDNNKFKSAQLERTPA